MGAPASHWEPLDDDDWLNEPEGKEKDFTKPSNRAGPSNVLPVPGMDPTGIDDQDLEWLDDGSSSVVVGSKDTRGSRRAVGVNDSSDIITTDKGDDDIMGWLNGTDSATRLVEKSRPKDPVKDDGLKGKDPSSGYAQTKKVKHNSPLRTIASKIVQAKIREMTTSTESSAMPEEVEMTGLSKSPNVVGILRLSSTATVTSVTSVLRPPTTDVTVLPTTDVTVLRPPTLVEFNKESRAGLAAPDLESNRDTRLLDSDDENWLNEPAHRPPFASSSQRASPPAARDLESNQGLLMLDRDDEQWLNDVGHQEKEPDALKKDASRNVLVLGPSLLLTASLGAAEAPTTATGSRLGVSGRPSDSSSVGGTAVQVQDAETAIAANQIPLVAIKGSQATDKSKTANKPGKLKKIEKGQGTITAEASATSSKNNFGDSVKDSNPSVYCKLHDEDLLWLNDIASAHSDIGQGVTTSAVDSANGTEINPPSNTASEQRDGALGSVDVRKEALRVGRAGFIQRLHEDDISWLNESINELCHTDRERRTPRLDSPSLRAVPDSESNTQSRAGLAAPDLKSNRDTQILDSDDENWLNEPAHRPPFASSSQRSPSPAARDLELNQGLQMLDRDDEQWLNDVRHQEREPDALKEDALQKAAVTIGSPTGLPVQTSFFYARGVESTHESDMVTNRSTDADGEVPRVASAAARLPSTPRDAHVVASIVNHPLEVVRSEANAAAPTHTIPSASSTVEFDSKDVPWWQDLRNKDVGQPNHLLKPTATLSADLGSVPTLFNPITLGPVKTPKKEVLPVSKGQDKVSGIRLEETPQSVSEADGKDRSF